MASKSGTCLFAEGNCDKMSGDKMSSSVDPESILIFLLIGDFPIVFGVGKWCSSSNNTTE